MRQFFNVKDFKDIPIKTKEKVVAASDSAIGKQSYYDVFISHSSKDKMLIQKVANLLEYQCGLSAYVDWDEDSGMPREEVADTVKDVMNRCHSFLIVKTSNSDKSSWVSWETGLYDAKNPDKIGVLLIENDDTGFNLETFEHQEYLKRYQILDKNELIHFVKEGAKKVIAARTQNFDLAFRQNEMGVDKQTGKLSKMTPVKSSSTKFYGNNHRK